MPVPPAPFQRHAQDRADSRPPGRVVRWALRVLLITAALLGTASPAMAAVHSVGGSTPARTAHVAHSAHTAHGTPGTSAAGTAVLTANLTPAVPGGICQVPGIGDIGGLIGLCSQGSSGIVGDLNNICEPSLPQPEPATGGIDAMIEPPPGRRAARRCTTTTGSLASSGPRTACSAPT